MLLHIKCGLWNHTDPSAPSTMLHVMLLTCISFWVHYKCQKTKDSFCFKKFYVFWRKEGKPSSHLPVYLLFSVFCIPVLGPMFLPTVTFLQPGELPVAFLECSSASSEFSHFPPFTFILGGHCQGAGSWWMVSISQHHCSWVPESNHFKGHVKLLWLLSKFSLPLWFSVLILDDVSRQFYLCCLRLTSLPESAHLWVPLHLETFQPFSVPSPPPGALVSAWVMSTDLLSFLSSPPYYPAHLVNFLFEILHFSVLKFPLSSFLYFQFFCCKLIFFHSSGAWFPSPWYAVSAAA